MKITPMAAGTGVPAASDVSIGRTATPERLERAKAIASGQSPVADTQSSGDAQVDRINTKRIKMKTQVSQNRHEFQQEAAENVQEMAQPIAEETQSTINDTVEQTQETEETRPLSPQFAALAKAKRALQVKEREIAQREEALKTQSPAGNDDFKARLKANPMSVLLEEGVTYEQLTNEILAQQSAPLDPQKLRAEIKQEILQELEGQFSSRDQLQEQQVLSEIEREVQSLVKSDADTYEVIRESGAQRDVVNLIHKIYKEGWPDKGYEPGFVLDERTAADIVENYLIEENLRFARLKKVQSRLTPQQELVAQIPTQPKANTKIMRTLTNRDSAMPNMDRRQRAIMAMQGTLKKG